MIRRRPSPDPPDLGPPLALPKPRRSERNQGPTDTRELALRKEHPERDKGFREWLKRQPCSVEGLRDQKTDQIHNCYSDTVLGYHPNGRARYASDPAHVGKSYSGRLKRTDVAGCFSLCRAAHSLQEDRMNAFDERFGIDRYDIAAHQYERYKKERGIEDDD